MPDVDDGYVAYYTDRLWSLLPGVYRARDSDDFETSGPLRELIARIAAQVAVTRRSIDRLWADQSIETSDDWVVPYLGDLLDTKLIDGLDGRGQRLDVAKTIHYRRRKGTVAILEEIARDVTGWDAHVVEAFRRLARTRHSLDPPVGPGPFAAALPTGCPTPAVPAGAPDVDELLRHEGLLGRLTHTPAGGLADLRAAHGASLADSPFDEFFHTADLRRGEGATGWYGISKLLVFLWRLQSFAVEGGTPVAVQGCPDEWVFDPTGRRVPLFLPPLPPEPDDYVDSWVSAEEWAVPGPLSQSLLETLDFITFGAEAGDPLEPVSIVAWPEAGQFRTTAPFEGALRVSYQYGFPGQIGAGPYDRTLLGAPPATIAPELDVSGGTNLDAALTGSGGAGTVTIHDSLSYAAVADVGTTAEPIGSLLLRAAPSVRPVIRLPSDAAWVFTGGAGAELTLDGLLVSGGVVVLRGAFARVRLTGCTLDPGTLDDDGALATAVDGRVLAPVQLWIEADPDAEQGAAGAIERLEIDHCVLGPIRSRGGGAVEALTIADSIVQGVAPAGAGLTVFDPEQLVRSLGAANPLSEHVLGLLSGGAQDVVTSYEGGSVAPSSVAKVVSSLNAAAANVFDETLFTDVPLPPEVAALVAEGAAADPTVLGLGALAAAFPVAIAVAAIAVTQGNVELVRTTVLGDTYLHRLVASDAVLAGFTVAEDAQDGCVRFSAVEAGSRVPRRYLSVATSPRASLFTSTAFGEPGYGQLLETADRAIVSGAAAVKITSGAETGSEMGAFSSLLAPIKERGLLFKYGEYMPLGLTPVIVHVT